MTVIFRRHAVDFDALQFTGDNFEEIRARVGRRATGDWNIDANKPYEIENFNPIGTYLSAIEEDKTALAELWDADAKQWKPVRVGDWIVQQDDGWLSVTDEWIHVNCIELDEEMLALIQEEERPKTFVENLTNLLNRHSVENASGTPDHILAFYMSSALSLFEQTIQKRADWRGESVELPALQKLHSGEKEVPLVIYTNGQRNEIGTAKVKVTPGEMAVTAEITGALPVFGKENISAAYSLELDEPKDEPLGALSGSEAMKDVGEAIPEGVAEGMTRFDRYQKKGLTDNG